MHGYSQPMRHGMDDSLCDSILEDTPCPNRAAAPPRTVQHAATDQPVCIPDLQVCMYVCMYACMSMWACMYACTYM